MQVTRPKWVAVQQRSRRVEYMCTARVMRGTDDDVVLTGGKHDALNFKALYNDSCIMLHSLVVQTLASYIGPYDLSQWTRLPKGIVSSLFFFFFRFSFFVQKPKILSWENQGTRWLHYTATAHWLFWHEYVTWLFLLNVRRYILLSMTFSQRGLTVWGGSLVAFL